MLVGLRDERARLRQLVDAQGAAAVFGDLESERAAPESPPGRSEEYRIGLQTACELERERLQVLLRDEGVNAVTDDLATVR